MTPILASTRSAFFQQHDFDFNPRAALHTEFCRLANFRKWKQGSNRKKFGKAWMQCFRLEVPIDYNFDGNGSLVSAPYGADNEGFSSLLGGSLQSLNHHPSTSAKRCSTCSDALDGIRLVISMLMCPSNHRRSKA